MKSIRPLHIIFIFLLMCCCCTSIENVNVEKITDYEARLIAAEFVNSEFKDHVWQTMLGERKFSPIPPDHWYEVIFSRGNFVLKSQGSRGQEFIVSMNADGTNIKIEHHGYSVR